ncbi:hypothetical protein AURDEDRAFT_182376 [Auricularia subglabra TFB-10046 SS5]|nr:hypothetical protein AURDEDRAFT_182376 [Auricularia subglabra TFB-10046 SS5]
MPALVPVDNTLGAAFIGLVLSAVVFGVTCLQVYEYYTANASGDTKSLRYFVAILLVLDTLHLVLVTHTMYFFLVTNFGDYQRLARIVWSLEIQVGVADLITALVQGFFAFRIYLLSDRKNWWLPALVVLCGLGLVSAAIGFMINGFESQYFSQTKYNIPWTIGGLTAELAGDTLMTAGMTFYLLRARTDFESTNRAINLLVTYTLNTGLLTTVFAILTLAMFVKTGETTFLYTPFFFILARLYSCAFMSTLNSRNRVRNAMSTRNAPDSYVLSNIGQGTNSSTARGTDVFVSSTKDEI